MKKTVTVLLIAAALPLLAEKPVLYSERFDEETRIWSTGTGERPSGDTESSLRPGAGRNGSNGLVWSYDFTGIKPQSSVYLRLRPIVKLYGKPVAFSIWIKGDKSMRTLLYRLRDGSGRTWQYNLCRLDFEGWKKIEAPIRPGGFAWGGTVRPDKQFSWPLTFLEFLMDYSRPGNFRNAGEIVLDDFTVYGEEKTVEVF